MSLFRAFYPILRTQNHPALISAVSPGTEEPIHLVQSPVDQNIISTTWQGVRLLIGQYLKMSCHPSSECLPPWMLVMVSSSNQTPFFFVQTSAWGWSKLIWWSNYYKTLSSVSIGHIANWQHQEYWEKKSFKSGSNKVKLFHEKKTL